MQAVEIARAIIANGYSNDELNNIADAIKFARTQLTRRNTGTFDNRCFSLWIMMK